nr:MAG TPA: tail protein [Caudoviricetes sp.]
MIYLFNNKEELIHIIKEQDLIEFTHKIEINTFDAAEFELPIEAIDKEIIEQMRFFGFFVRGRQFGVFKAYEVTTTDNYVIKGLDRAESDLRTVRIIKDKRLQSVTADQALNVALEGTGYQLGEREGLTKVNKTNFYYISPREALVKIIEAFNCEFRVRYEFVENKIINRYIDLYHRQGSYSGVQFEYGNNALEVTMEEDSDNVVTALIGRGKGEESTDSEGNATGGYGRRIEFTDIVWTKASGKPVDKPAGQNYIVLNDDIENKGLYQNGELKHRWGVFVDEEIEDKEVLLQATYQELLRLNNPIRKYKASILDLRDDIWLGDRVAIVKDSAKLSFEARIFSITIDKLNFDQSEVELGDYETLKSQSQSSSLNAVKEAVRELSEEQEAYNRKVQEMIDNKNAEIAEKMRVMRLDMDNGIEDAKNKAEKVKQEVAAKVDETVKVASQKAKNEITQEFNATYGDITVKMEKLKSTTDQLKTSDVDIKKLINDFKDQTQSQFAGVQGAQSRFEQTTEKAISDLTNVTNGKADRSYVEQTVNGIKEEFTSIGAGGGPNMLRNSRADEGLKYWTEANNRLAFTAHKFYFNGQKRMFELRPGAVVKSPRFIVKQNVDYVLNILGFDTNSKYFRIYFCKRKKGSTADFEEKQLVFDGKPQFTDGPVFNNSKAIKKSFQFNVGNFDDGYLQFEYERNNPNNWAGLFMTELDCYEGTNDRKWQPAPEDQNYLVEQAQATFEKTVEGLTAQLTKLETKTGPSGELEQRMLTYSEKAAVDALKATRQILEQGYVAKSQYTEDVAGITRRFEDLKQNNDQVISSKIAEYKQTVEGQFTTITNQMGDMLIKTDIQITDGRISFGTGKSVDGRTISSLLVQEPEAIALIAQLIKVKGDMVVDGSITSRHLASQSVRTGHMESGSVTTQILASNSVTADKLLVDSAMIDKLVTNQAFIRELMAQKAFITQLASIDISANRFTGDRIQSSDGSLLFDLVKNQLTMSSNTAAIVREDAGYPTHFIRYESSIEQNQKHSRTIIGSNRNGSKNWNSVSFAGVVIDNNSNNGVDKIFQYGDYNHMRHASGDDGWNFSVVTQTLTPGIWKKNSEIWCRHFVIPKKTKSDTDSPTEFIRLDESVAALWKLWAHALGQINMTGAMKSKVQGMLDAFSFDRDHIK